MLHDCRGHRLTGATRKACPITRRRCASSISSSTIRSRASTRPSPPRPDFLMAHALRAWLHLLGTEPAGIPVAHEALEAARRLPATTQEQGHLAAIEHLVAGRWHAASQVLEDVAIEHPRDLLALQVGHQLDFFRGDSRMLRDRIARALPAWSPGVPGYHAMLGMHAFGLEETGDYAAAENDRPRSGRARAPRRLGAARGGACDGDAGPPAGRHRLDARQHRRLVAATASSRSTTGGTSRSITSISAISTRCSRCSTARSTARSSRLILEMIDASAMLWRLHLRGIDVGDRWQAVADAWEPVEDAGNYAFNDAHAAMAFVGAGRPQSLARVIEAQNAGDAAQTTTTPLSRREVGRPVVLAIKAFGDGNYAETVRRLREVRNIAHRFGGSHAQRDVIDLTLDRGGAARRTSTRSPRRSPPSARRCGRRARWRGCSCSAPRRCGRRRKLRPPGTQAVASGSCYCALAPLAGRGHGNSFNDFGRCEGGYQHATREHTKPRDHSSLMRVAANGVAGRLVVSF